MCEMYHDDVACSGIWFTNLVTKHAKLLCDSPDEDMLDVIRTAIRAMPVHCSEDDEDAVRKRCDEFFACVRTSFVVRFTVVYCKEAPMNLTRAFQVGYAESISDASAQFYELKNNPMLKRSVRSLTDKTIREPFRKQFRCNFGKVMCQTLGKTDFNAVQSPIIHLYDEIQKLETSWKDLHSSGSPNEIQDMEFEMDDALRKLNRQYDIARVFLKERIVVVG